MLTFGGASSAGIYDDLAKLIKDLAILASETDRRMVNQVLDDVVAVRAEGEGYVSRFHGAYRSICSKVRISLADESDRDKAFRATNTGKVLGIAFDLNRWVWRIPEEKLNPLLGTLQEIIENKEVENHLAMSLNGKLNHYMWVVSDEPWQQGFLLRLQDSMKPPTQKMVVPALAQE